MIKCILSFVFLDQAPRNEDRREGPPSHRCWVGGAGIYGSYWHPGQRLAETRGDTGGLGYNKLQQLAADLLTQPSFSLIS